MQWFWDAMGLRWWVAEGRGKEGVGRDACSRRRRVPQVLRVQQLDRLEQLEELGDVVGQRLSAMMTDMASQWPRPLRVDRLVAVRPKIVHRRVWIAAYSCVMPLDEEQTARPSTPATSVSPHDEIPVRRS
jgi:hypothetical protein